MDDEEAKETARMLSMVLDVLMVELGPEEWINAENQLVSVKIPASVNAFIEKTAVNRAEVESFIINRLVMLGLGVLERKTKFSDAHQVATAKFLSLVGGEE